jgi:hypothetical protein
LAVFGAAQLPSTSRHHSTREKVPYLRAVGNC